jgi:hypothetical protein
LRIILLGRGGRVGETNRYFCTKNLSAVCDFFLNICDAFPIKAFMLPTFSGCLMGKMGAQLKNAGDAVKTHIASFWLMFGHAWRPAELQSGWHSARSENKSKLLNL